MPVQTIERSKLHEGTRIKFTRDYKLSDGSIIREWTEATVTLVKNGTTKMQAIINDLPVDFSINFSEPLDWFRIVD